MNTVLVSRNCLLVWGVPPAILELGLGTQFTLATQAAWKWQAPYTQTEVTTGEWLRAEPRTPDLCQVSDSRM